MREIINGKRYDTEKATLIGEYNNLGRGCDSVTDFKFCEEGLYVTRSGNYFLAGEGGAMSKYAGPAGQNASQGGSGITPISKDEAYEWAERHLEPAELEKHFYDTIVDA